MSELERLLSELGRTTHEPEPPPVARRVAAELRRRQRPRRRMHLGRTAAIGLAVAAVGAVAAVPVARTSLLRFLHLGGVTVERVDKLPAVTPRAPLAPGRDLGLARARARVSFTILVPERDSRPTHTFYDASDPPGGQVTLVYGSLGQPRLLVTEFLGANAEGAFNKKVGHRTRVEPVEVGGRPGIWLGGAKHAFSFLDGRGTTRTFETRLAAHTLVWQRGRLTLRLEGDLSKSEAIRLARSFRAAS